MSEAKVQKILSQLLRDPENTYCADCKTAHNPRWASWSLGVFICIKCAGTHRSLGTHISKVKSVDLDTWELVNVEKLVYYKNNKIANAYYEGKLASKSADGKYVPNQSQLSSFIRTKYEMKKWVDSDVNIRALVDSKATPNLGKLSSSSSSSSLASPSGSVGSRASNSGGESLASSLLDLDLNPIASTVSLRSATSSTQGINRQQKSAIKSSSTVTPTSTSASTSTSTSTSTSNNTVNTGTGSSNIHTITKDNRPELKKSILSLYAKPASSSSPQLNYANNNTSGFPVGSQPTLSSNNSSISNLFPNSAINNTSQSNTNNNNNNNNSSVSLEDNDLFKNVWG